MSATRVSTAPITLLEVDLLDNEVIVQAHADGKFTLEQSEPRLVLTLDQFQQIVGGFAQIGKSQGWL